MFSLFTVKRPRKARGARGALDGDEDVSLLETNPWPLGVPDLQLCDPGDLKRGSKRRLLCIHQHPQDECTPALDQYGSNCSLNSTSTGTDQTDDETTILIPPPAAADAEKACKAPPVFGPSLAPVGGAFLGMSMEKDSGAGGKSRIFSRRRCQCCVLGVAAALAAILMAALVFFYVNINDGLRIAYGDRKSEMVMTWHSGSQLVPPTVVYRQIAPALPTSTMAARAVGRSDGFAKSVLTTQYINRVTLANLTLGATYEYIYGESVTAADFVDPAEADTEIHRFRVPEDREASVSMAVFGDMGAFGGTVMSYILHDVEAGKYDFAFHIGDFAYDLDSFFGLVGDLWFSNLRPVAANLPYMVTPGNHESGEGGGGWWLGGRDVFNQYMNRFTMPQHAETKNLWYAFEVGPVKVISISTEALYTHLAEPLAADDQMRWLEAELTFRTNRTRTPWLVTMSHRPMYCSNEDDDCNNHVRNPVRAQLEDLLDHHNVTVAFWAHEHSYERTCSVFNGRCGPDEPGGAEVVTSYDHVPVHPVHVITGSAGSVEGFDAFERGKSEWTRAQDLHWGFGQMRATYSSFSWSQHHIIDDVLTTVDHFEILQ